MQELLAGGAGLWGGGEVDQGSPDSDCVPPAEGHPEPRERGSLAQRVAGQRRAAVVRDVARQLAGRVVHGEKREHGVHGHSRWLQLRVRRGHEHIYRREFVGPSKNSECVRTKNKKEKGRGVSVFRIHEQEKGRHVERLLPFGEAVGVRLEPDGVPLAVHVEEPQEREPRLAEERREPAARRRRAGAGAAQQGGGTVGEEGEEQGEGDEVG